MNSRKEIAGKIVKAFLLKYGIWKDIPSSYKSALKRLNTVAQGKDKPTRRNDGFCACGCGKKPRTDKAIFFSNDCNRKSSSGTSLSDDKIKELGRHVGLEVDVVTEKFYKTKKV